LVENVMKFRPLYIALVAALALPALSHPGPRIWLDVQVQQVTTFQGPYPPSDPSSYAPSRVFTQPLIADAGTWYTDFPGFQQVPGGTISSGTTFSYDITGPLLYFEPAAGARSARFRTVARHFADSPPAPQFAVTNELFQTKITADGFVPGDLAFAYNGGAGDHNHLTYTFLGDGATASDGPDGIYALQLRMTSAGLAPSDTFFLLLGKNVPDPQLTAAASLASKTLILPGDANTDGVVNFADFQSLERGFAKPDPAWSDGDFNSDGLVDAADFTLLRDHFGDRLDGNKAAIAPFSESAVPEPQITALLVCSLVPLLLRRRRVVRQSSNVFPEFKQ
jgi:hypothetical protein